MSLWYRQLLNFKRELSDDMSPKELEFISALFQSAHPLVMEASQNKNQKSIDYGLYMQLDSIEIELRKIFKSKGYKTKYARMPGEVMG